MNWHTGNIAEAVADSRAKDAIFVVYIEGEDEMSTKLDRFLADERVYSKLMTSDFVAVKIQGNSPTYEHFSSLYKLVPVPSIFFIGKSGTPLDITTGIIESVGELVDKIDKVLLLAGKRTDPDAASTSKPETTATPDVERSIAGAEEESPVEAAQAVEQNAAQSSSEASVPEAVETPVVKEAAEAVNAPAVVDVPNPNDVSQPAVAVEPTATALSAAAAAEKRAQVAAANVVASVLPVSVPLVPAATAQADSSSAQSTSEPPRSVDIQQLVEQKKAERQEEQRRREKESELRRRREGREAQVQQALTREQEMKNMQERIRRERQQEQEARERILAQIAADRAEQANRAEAQSASSVSTSATTKTVTLPDSSTSGEDETRLQIRLPGGVTRTKAFPIQEPLASVRVYIVSELLGGTNIRDFTLATSYPRREFKTEDEVKTLIDLNLVPNAVLLVLQREQVNSVVRTSNNLLSILSSVFWAILTPATMALDYCNKMGLQRIRQRFMLMLSNVGIGKTPDRAAAGNEMPSAQDASARRNMGMFSLGPGQPGNEPSEAKSTHSADPSSSTFFSQDARASSQQATKRRYGESNIRRLADTTKDDDDKATYNGNSTQQQ